MVHDIDPRDASSRQRRAVVSDGRKLLLTRGIRGLADGVVSIALATSLTSLGFSAIEVGAIITGTLLGSAAVTLGVGLLGYRLRGPGSGRMLNELPSVVRVLAVAHEIPGHSSFSIGDISSPAGLVAPSAKELQAMEVIGLDLRKAEGSGS
jgi:hypothetical protein